MARREFATPGRRARVPRWAVALAALVAIVGCATRYPRYVGPTLTVGDRTFTRAVEAHTQSGLVDGNRVELLLNGDEIFPAMRAAIRNARATITLATYLYEDGEIADRIAVDLAERCRAGVRVHILLDAIGSHEIDRDNRQRLHDAGCLVEAFRPIGLLDPRRVNHRNHRRSLVVDGRQTLLGGTGIGARWTGDGRQAGHWRQTDARVEGPIVRAVQASFAETWREATGVLLGGDDYFPDLPRRGDVLAQAVKSSPSAGAAEAFALFLLSIEAAHQSILLTSPYFVPDDAMLDALTRAAQRGVRVSVLVAGDAGTLLDRVVRRASQQSFGRALRAGVRIHEYTAANLHAKTFVVDGLWSSIGSVNLDNRSFALNHELNLTVLDRAVAQRLEPVFADDLRYAREVTLEQWEHRGVGRVLELFVLPLRDQL
jgi:cardiolipin synthase